MSWVATFVGSAKVLGETPSKTHQPPTPSSNCALWKVGRQRSFSSRTGRRVPHHPRHLPGSRRVTPWLPSLPTALPVPAASSALACLLPLLLFLAFRHDLRMA